MKLLYLLFLTAASLMSLQASAQIKVGVTVSATGPAASLGIPERNAITLMPKELGKYQIEYIVYDDASDTTAARKNFEKLVSQDRVDLVIGSSTTPASLAMLDLAAQHGTPMISLGAGRNIVEPMDAQRKWVFKTPYNDSITAAATVAHMIRAKVKTVGFIGFNDAYGEGWNAEFKSAATSASLQIVATEFYNRNDLSVTAQALRLMIAKPDAIIVAASGTPAVLPQATLSSRGYKGRVYQTSGVTNNDFIRVGGKSVEDTYVAAAPVVVASELPVSHPARTSAELFRQLYERQHGAGSLNAFAGYAWDAWLLARDALQRVGDKAQPGSPDYRNLLRDALESGKSVTTTNGLVNMTPTDHNGFGQDAPVIIRVKDGRWSLAK